MWLEPLCSFVLVCDVNVANEPWVLCGCFQVSTAISTHSHCKECVEMNIRCENTESYIRRVQMAVTCQYWFSSRSLFVHLKLKTLHDLFWQYFTFVLARKEMELGSRKKPSENGNQEALKYYQLCFIAFVLLGVKYLRANIEIKNSICCCIISIKLVFAFCSMTLL